MKKLIFSKYIYIPTAFLIFIAGYIIGKSNKSEAIDASFNSIRRNITEVTASTIGLDDRKLVLMENPNLIDKIKKGASFGNDKFSVSAAQNMFGKDEDAIKDIINKTDIEKVTDNVWAIYLPIVNCSVIETSDGLIIIDTGMKPAGPAILKAVESISSKKIHTIIYTHGHVDHAYGTWALIGNGNNPQIIAHENLLARNQRYLKLRGSLAKYMSQPLDQLPKDSTDLIWPTITFQDELELQVGEVSLFLKHFEGETDDQLLVWIPDQKIVFSADYYQGFMPNAGNGKRVQRNISKWIDALKYMTNLNPKILVPSHGKVIFDENEVNEALAIHAENLEYIYNYTVEALNKGLRKDQIVTEFELPEYLSDHPLLSQKYVSGRDICKMVIRQYTGWWDDIPSHWSPASIYQQAFTIVELSGGMDNFINHIRDISDSNLQLAAHFVDWAYYADPDNSEVHELVLEIYKKRILDENSMTQEMLVYLDHMTEVRGKIKNLK